MAHHYINADMYLACMQSYMLTSYKTAAAGKWKILVNLITIVSENSAKIYHATEHDITSL